MIRRPRPDEIKLLPQIENEADRRYVRVGLERIVGMPPASIAALELEPASRPALDRNLAARPPVGFALMKLMADVRHRPAQLGARCRRSCRAGAIPATLWPADRGGARRDRRQRRADDEGERLRPLDRHLDLERDGRRLVQASDCLLDGLFRDAGQQWRPGREAGRRSEGTARADRVLCLDRMGVDRRAARRVSLLHQQFSLRPARRQRADRRARHLQRAQPRVPAGRHGHRAARLRQVRPTRLAQPAMATGACGNAADAGGGFRDDANPTGLAQVHGRRRPAVPRPGPHRRWRRPLQGRARRLLRPGPCRHFCRATCCASGMSSSPSCGSRPPMSAGRCSWPACWAATSRPGNAAPSICCSPPSSSSPSAACSANGPASCNCWARRGSGSATRAGNISRSAAPGRSSSPSVSSSGSACCGATWRRRGAIPSAAASSRSS